jgi:hypothetical protein
MTPPHFPSILSTFLLLVSLIVLSAVNYDDVKYQLRSATNHFSREALCVSFYLCSVVFVLFLDYFPYVISRQPLKPSIAISATINKIIIHSNAVECWLCAASIKILFKSFRTSSLLFNKSILASTSRYLIDLSYSV